MNKSLNCIKDVYLFKIYLFCMREWKSRMMMMLLSCLRFISMIRVLDCTMGSLVINEFIFSTAIVFIVVNLSSVLTSKQNIIRRMEKERVGKKFSVFRLGMLNHRQLLSSLLFTRSKVNWADLLNTLKVRPEPLQVLVAIVYFWTWAYIFLFSFWNSINLYLDRSIGVLVMIFNKLLLFSWSIHFSLAVYL